MKILKGVLWKYNSSISFKTRETFFVRDRLTKVEEHVKMAHLAIPAEVMAHTCADPATITRPLKFNVAKKDE